MEETTDSDCKVNAPTNSKSQLIIDIEETLRISECSRSSKHCIYRVPYELRKWNQEAYAPQVISIGPYHHGEERYKSMEKLKVECLENFRRRTKLNVEDLVNIIMKLERRVRDCYANDIKFGRNDFVKIILVDASFIVEFLATSESERFRLVDPWLWWTILRDLRKFENQLPFFVTEKLYDLVRGPNSESFTELSLSLFFRANNEILSALRNSEIKHFVDLLRTTLQPREENNDQGTKSCMGILKTIEEVKLCINWLRTSLGPQKRRSNEEDNHAERSSQSQEADNGDEADDQAENLRNMPQREAHQYHHQLQNLPSVSKLHRAGVKLEVSSSEWLLKLEFINGILKIPKLRISDGTDSYFRNIMAFEQRYYPYNSYVTNYITLLDSLINKTEDVDLLVEEGIIVNWIGDNNTATNLINNLGKGLWRFSKTEDYVRLAEELKAFHKNPCHRWKAILVRDYFSTPWRIASSAAAIILLVLTFIQTVCSLIPFFKT